MDRSTEIAPNGLPFLTNLGAREDDCQKHGPYSSTGVRLARGREVWTQCPGCRADDEAAEVARKEAQAAEARRVEMERLLEEAAIPARFIGKTLDSFNAKTDAQRAAVTIARDFIENFPERYKRGDSLVLSGLPGTGKSHIAGAILQGILPKYLGMYVTCMGIIRSVRGTWRKDSERSETQMLNLFGQTALLVVDEIGVQYGTDGEQTILFDVLDRRYREMMPTILLTNQNKEGLKQFIGERSFDRLTETARWVSFDWNSYRPQARAA
jgi:DNA replication protein DnaC